MAKRTSKGKKPTVRDVAKKAGVALGTVSKVLNRDVNVRRSTYDKVMKAVDQLGYVLPPPERRPIRKDKEARKGLDGQVNTIAKVAFLIPAKNFDAVETPLAKALSQGMKDYYYDNKIELIMVHLDEDGRLPEEIKSKQVDGIIMRGVARELVPNRDDRKLLELYPVVSLLWGNGLNTDDDCVRYDDFTAGRLAAKQLIAKGAERVICAINFASLNSTSMTQRLAGAAMECSAAGIEFEKLQRDQINKAEFKDELVALVKSDESKSTGVFVAYGEPEIYEQIKSDCADREKLILSGVFDAKEMLKDVPKEVVAVFLNAYEVGKSAAEQLLWRRNNGDSTQRSVLITPSLLKRR